MGFNDRNLNELDEGDGDFETFICRRTQRLYLGGFQASVTERAIMDYAERRGVYVSWINIRRFDNQNRAVIRLNVDAEHGPLLLEEGFWPRGVSCRRWYTKNQYNNKVWKRRYHRRSSDSEYHKEYNRSYDNRHNHEGY